MPCRKEAPYISKFQEKYGKQGFQAVAVNANNDKVELVRNYVQDNNLKHKYLVMGSAISEDPFAVKSIPTNYYLAHTGKIVYRENGFSREMVADIEGRIVDLLEKRKKAIGAAK